MGAPGGGLSAQLLPFRCPQRVVASRCSCFRRDQRPSVHRAHPAAVGASPGRCIPGIPSTTCTRRSRFRGGRPATMNRPAARHGACKLVWADTQWRSARSGTVGVAPVRAPLRGCSVALAVSSRRRFAPSHIPTDGLFVGRTPDRARGPLFAFRKIHLYGKTKKSTHGHQTAKPFCTHF